MKGKFSHAMEDIKKIIADTFFFHCLNYVLQYFILKSVQKFHETIDFGWKIIRIYLKAGFGDWILNKISVLESYDRIFLNIFSQIL